MRTLADIKAAVRQLQGELERQHEVGAALELCKALGGFYTTPTEALIAIVEALDTTAAAWGACLEGRRHREVEELAHDARALMNLR